MKLKLVLPIVIFLLSVSSFYAQTFTYDNFRSGIIQWQSSSDSASWTNIPRANEAQYTPNAPVKTFYRAMILDGLCDGSIVYSDVYTYSPKLMAKSIISFKVAPVEKYKRVSVRFAPLKYNKRFAIGVTSDDQGITAWNRLFSYFNGRWIDDEKNYHPNMSRSEGAYAPRALTYTDGCGVVRRFSINSANWYNSRGQYWQYPMEHEDPNHYWPYLVWAEQLEINDFDGACSFHDVQDPAADKEGGTVNQVLNGLIDANDNYVYKILGRKLMVMTEPGGESQYSQAAGLYPNIKMITSQHKTNLGFTYVNLADSTDFTKLKVGRYFRDENTFDQHKKEIEGEIINKSINGAHFYGEFGLHGLHDKIIENYTASNISSSAKIKTFDWLCDTYGEHGSDEMWFATNDEVIQYKYLNSVTNLNYSVNNDSLTINLEVPELDDFYWYEYTLLIDGLDVSDIDNVKVQNSKRDLIGLSYGESEGQLMLNLNYDTTLLTRADKYTSLFETNVLAEKFTDQSLQYKRDAEYFIQRLRPSLQGPFRQRIDSIAKAPVLNSIIINSGARETSDRNVSVNLDYEEGIPMQYRISESNDFSNAQWKPMEDPIVYKLSLSGGDKTLYVQLRNPFGETNICQSSIHYTPPPLDLKSIAINSNAINTESNEVSVCFNYIGLPTHYKLSEDSSFIDTQWKSWTDDSPILFSLSSGYGKKTLYAKMKNDSIELAVNNSIDYIKEGVVISFAGTALNQIAYPKTDAGTTINLLQIAPNTNYSAKELRSVSDHVTSWAIELNSSLYQSNDQTQAQGTYLTVVNNLQPSLSGDTGVYPDTYLSKLWTINGSGEKGAKKGRIVFTLPEGSYKLKLLMSASANAALNAAQLSDSWYRIDVDDVKGTPVNVGNRGFTALNNNKFNAEIDIVVPKSETVGNVVLYLYNNSNFYYRPGINLIEIIKTD